VAGPAGRSVAPAGGPEVVPLEPAEVALPAADAVGKRSVGFEQRQGPADVARGDRLVRQADVGRVALLAGHQLLPLGQPARPPLVVRRLLGATPVLVDR